ncbi:TetR/AcrR family transcriptional regulator [Streptomyces rectiverticillatus]|uniref:TetR/AcrR family transcriptional regulator n=1 Tax=Streptomyces rectiverticillatus TaxID=173860 RepID=UPI0015C2CB0A|nr:TetR/AcrR family transcriptional regulator [Streptomyces rectiverticillatus]QLE75144.1 TetR/AcrR family transcriptional regulator [Streptomyces rectiverticillatus]
MAAAPDTDEPKRPTRPTRSTYRHGDLRNALIKAGVELAREGGPEAVVLRAATRHAGVVPNAAYRHFADRGALLHAVSQAAMARVARTMEAEQAALPPATDAKEAARARFRAVGTGYLRFAQEEPGLFRAAFHVPGDMSHAADDDAAGSGGTPFELLGAALDDLVETGALPEDRRPGAEFLAWSAVHGLAVLLIDGPLRGLHPTQAHDAGRHVIDMIERGI